MRAYLPILLSIAAIARAQLPSDLRVTCPLPEGDALVIGFLGAWERWDDPNRAVRQTVMRLRETPGIHAESLSNHHRDVALDLVKRAFDRNQDGLLDTAEASKARVVIFGQSLGGSATVKLARELEQAGVPVRLTVQVDSVGFGDGVIPANVRSAANFYQRGLLTIRGEKRIRAADPQKTSILANRQWHDHLVYRMLPDQRFRRTFGGGHARMELDPSLWIEIESLIRSAI